MNSGLAFLLLCSARLSVGPLPEKKLVHRIRLTKKDSRPKNFFAGVELKSNGFRYFY